jgi:hypothetical protein
MCSVEGISALKGGEEVNPLEMAGEEVNLPRDTLGFAMELP